MGGSKVPVVTVRNCLPAMEMPACAACLPSCHGVVLATTCITWLYGWFLYRMLAGILVMMLPGVLLQGIVCWN